MERYICIHGHFYQPPRENPWLEAVELQDSAHPYHDWNERITAECYAPNAASRILDPQGRIVEIVNNYSKISFDFGPTLLAWLELNDPDTYRAILEADQESRLRFSGHGSAIAQAYNHIILPLANSRDKRTQVLWGIRDFRHRFGRDPEGMWAPETAVDLETLDIFAEAGIRFTILAPHQASRVRPIGSSTWQDVNGARIDPTQVYRLQLPSGREIALFFYDGPVSRAVAFEDLLNNGERFAQRLVGLFDPGRDAPQLVHIATDGETYGHHHPHGEMALSYALHYLESRGLARLTNFGEYLERHPPTLEVEIYENTSWSCAHGVERWRSDCGCHTGGQPGWNQAWRKPLRDALDWLRDTLSPRYEAMARQYLADPWAARDDYIEVILNRSADCLDAFLARHATRPLTPEEKTTVARLLELQRHGMLMYTSCGWFFHELSGIETVQVLQYAARAVQLAQELFGDDIEAGFLERLEQAKSNIPERGDGRRIYETLVKPATVDLLKVGAHYAVSSLFQPYAGQTRVYCYTVDLEGRHSLEAGDVKLIAGRARVTSEITLESARQAFGVLYLGGQNLHGGIRTLEDESTYQALVDELETPFRQGDLPAVLGVLDRRFHGSTYSLKSLFRDEQRKILGRILESTVEEAADIYREIYEHNAPLMRTLCDLGIPLPPALKIAAEFVLNTSLSRVFATQTPDLERARALLEEARASGVALNARELGYAVRTALEWLAERLHDNPAELDLLERLLDAARFATSLPFEVNLWRVQNLCYDMLRNAFPEFRRRADQGDRLAQEWVRHFVQLGETLSIAVA